MSNLAWLAISWTLVAAVCYFIVFKLGRQTSGEGQENQSGQDQAAGKHVNSLGYNRFQCLTNKTLNYWNYF